MYDWVEAAGLQLKQYFCEMTYPANKPTRFEQEWHAYFQRYKELERVKYVLAIEHPQRDYTGRSYSFMRLLDTENIILKLAEFRVNGIRTPLLFRTDMPFEDQWPFPTYGIIHSPCQLSEDLLYCHQSDIAVLPPPTRVRGKPQFQFIRGVVMGGLS